MYKNNKNESFEFEALGSKLEQFMTFSPDIIQTRAKASNI